MTTLTNQIILIFGKKRVGKTLFAGALCEMAIDSGIDYSYIGMGNNLPVKLFEKPSLHIVEIDCWKNIETYLKIDSESCVKILIQRGLDKITQDIQKKNISSDDKLLLIQEVINEDLNYTDIYEKKMDIIIPNDNHSSKMASVVFNGIRSRLEKK